jgi:hypothetical protein
MTASSRFERRFGEVDSPSLVFRPSAWNHSVDKMESSKQQSFASHHPVGREMHQIKPNKASQPMSASGVLGGGKIWGGAHGWTLSFV